MAEQTLNGYSVLIVDDDSDIREIYAAAFESAGLTVYKAKDGDEGLEEAKKNNPSLILLDLMMPGTDGRTMLKKLKADAGLKNIPVVIFSALITELERQDTITAGAVEYIEKSDVQDPDDLLAKITPHLGKK